VWTAGKQSKKLLAARTYITWSLQLVLTLLAMRNRAWTKVTKNKWAVMHKIGRPE